MTRQIGIGAIKGKKGYGSNRRNRDGRPREGSKLRDYYDALRRGETVDMRSFPNAIIQLRDVYGMDLKGTGHGHVLLGEWDGPYFVPFERILQEDS